MARKKNPKTVDPVTDVEEVAEQAPVTVEPEAPPVARRLSGEDVAYQRRVERKQQRMKEKGY